jgi:SAM-dependent methyltransferase
MGGESGRTRSCLNEKGDPVSDWQYGYVTDTPYTFGYYRECALNWIDWVAILSGSEPPVGARRVLELGCGQGYGLCVMAAANPEYHFVGVDFNPEHIAHAKSLSRRTGLKNIDFFENDFISLTERPKLPWEACDYMITHGILSWVNAEVRRAVFQIADKCLVPGGLAYFSYNALPGWLSSHPVQHLMRQFADRTGVNAGSFKNALNTLKSLKDVNASVFSAQPGLVKKLEQLEKNPENKTNYLYHEYFNNAWSLFYCTQIADEARAWKLQYLGSATLPDNYDTMLPENMRKVLDAAPDHSMRELYKDMMINQSFRRDVFVRGKA